MSNSYENNSRSVFSIFYETEHDVHAREALLDSAMGKDRKLKSSEKIREGRLPAPGLAFVCRTVDGRLIGTVRLWNIRIPRHDNTFIDALLLGPLAVCPSAKGLGAGTLLMQHAIDEARRLYHGAVLLVGDPGYYARFGFSSEKTSQIAMPGFYEKHRFQALELIPGYLDGAQGVVIPSGDFEQQQNPAFCIMHTENEAAQLS